MYKCVCVEGDDAIAGRACSSMCGFIWFVKFQNVDELQGAAKGTFLGVVTRGKHDNLEPICKCELGSPRHDEIVNWKLVSSSGRFSGRVEGVHAHGPNLPGIPISSVCSPKDTFRYLR